MKREEAKYRNFGKNDFSSSLSTHEILFTMSFVSITFHGK